MVRRSLEAANAISAGNSISLTASATMVIPYVRDRLGAFFGAPAPAPILERRSLPFG
jgi:hypothetical protein